MINLADYMTANSSLTQTQALQACVAMKKPILVPPTIGYRPLTNPIYFADFLHIEGETSVQISGVEFSNLLGNTGATNGRPLFIGGRYDGSGNFTGWYADLHQDNLYRIVYRGATPSGADTNWASSWTTDPIADIKYLDTVLGGQAITIKNMFIYNADSYGSIINSHATKPAVFRNCEFAGDGSGLILNGFQISVDNCQFSGNLPSWLWMDSAVWDRFQAGTQTAGDIVIKANIDRLISRSYGLYVGGNGEISNSRSVWAGGTGMAINGNGTIATGIRIEKSFKGLVIGNLPFLDMNTLASIMLATNKLVSGLPAAGSVALNTKAFVTDSTVAYNAGLGAIVAGGGSNTAQVYTDGINWRIGNNAPLVWGATGGIITSVEMESCYEGVIFGNCNTPVNGMNVIGSYANQYDGTTGECLAGIINRSMNAPYSGINSTINYGGNVSVRSIGIDGGIPLVINEPIEDQVRGRLASLTNQRISIEALSPTQKARFLAAIGG